LEVSGEASIMRYRKRRHRSGIGAIENDTSALSAYSTIPQFWRGAPTLTGAQKTVGSLRSILGNPFRSDYQLSDGLPFGRYLPVKDFNQGVFGILMRQRGPGESGSVGGYITTHYRNLDLRISREFSWSPGRLSAVMDIFNVENRAGALIQTDVTAPTHLYRIPLRFQTPRSIQLGIHYRW
jgi:hypothetical protein